LSKKKEEEEEKRKHRKKDADAQDETASHGPDIPFQRPCAAILTYHVS
jgi:hypothetical protein